MEMVSKSEKYAKLATLTMRAPGVHPLKPKH
jgi:hypothetical protein